LLQDECAGLWCPPGGLPSGEAVNLGQVLKKGSKNDHLNIQVHSHASDPLPRSLPDLSGDGMDMRMMLQFFIYPLVGDAPFADVQRG
jgi:hypothetical protein